MRALACLAMLALAMPAAAQRVPDGFTFGAGGDLPGPYRPLAFADDPTMAPVAKLFRSADPGHANHEGAMFDIRSA